MLTYLEKFTSGLLRTSVALGVPTFTLGYLFSGIDRENLAVGIIGGTVAILLGAEIFNWSVQHILAGFGWGVTLFETVVVAAAVSFEEVPRMLVPARRGHAEISIGNILGTVMFFVLYNARLIAMIHPLVLDVSVLNFYWPALMVVLAVTSGFLRRGRIGQVAGGVLLVGYAAYIALAIWGGYRLMS